jgi:starch-binding outer membrane protein, SusD/RagB family
MKKYFVYIIIVVSIIGCSKNLDQKPISSLIEENFYRNAEEVESGVIGAYASLRDVYNLDPILAGLRSDDAYISVSEGDINQIDGFGEVTTNSFVGQYWQNAYFTIKQCNTILKYINNVTDSVKKKNYEGEAKFIRAHMYFNLVRLWGDVPLVIKDLPYNDLSAGIRVNKDTVYTQIINDFTDATNYLPTSVAIADAGRVNSYAAKGMLAKVFLTLKRYNDAKVILWDLLQNPGQHQFSINYRSIFGPANETNSEILYSVRFRSNSNGMGNTFTFNMDRLSGSVGYRAASDFRGNTPFPNADSIRKFQTFLTGGSYGTSWYCGGKYLDPGTARNDGGTDFIVLRYADIIMMYAEVENEINGDVPLTASDLTNPQSRLFQLNRIRTRASGPAPSAVPVYAINSASVNSKANFLRTIKAERRREFGMESQRWYDLLRWDDAITVMNAHFLSRAINVSIQPYQALFPIPQREIDISNGVMKQNPGYK